MQSLSNALVRDATARYYRWRRGEPPTRTPKLIKTEVCGAVKPAVLSQVISNQINLTCDCRVENSSISFHRQAVIGGKKFYAGEPLIPGKRCGSVIIQLIDGRSVYGLVKKFLRIVCDCVRVRDFVIVTWFPRPVYPDRDPLTVRINLGGLNVNTMNNHTVSSLNDIQPSRVIVDCDTGNDCLYPMRIEGTDTI